MNNTVKIRGKNWTLNNVAGCFPSDRLAILRSHELEKKYPADCIVYENRLGLNVVLCKRLEHKKR